MATASAMRLYLFSKLSLTRDPQPRFGPHEAANVADFLESKSAVSCYSLSKTSATQQRFGRP